WPRLRALGSGAPSSIAPIPIWPSPSPRSPSPSQASLPSWSSFSPPASRASPASLADLLGETRVLVEERQHHVSGGRRHEEDGPRHARIPPGRHARLVASTPEDGHGERRGIASRLLRPGAAVR